MSEKLSELKHTLISKGKLNQRHKMAGKYRLKKIKKKLHASLGGFQNNISALNLSSSGFSHNASLFAKSRKMFPRDVGDILLSFVIFLPQMLALSMIDCWA